jgi:hypothetical protein
VEQSVILDALGSNLGQAGIDTSGKIFIREMSSNPVFSRLDTLNSNSDTLVFRVGQAVRWYLRVNPIEDLEKADQPAAMAVATQVKAELQDLLGILQYEAISAQQYKTSIVNQDLNGFKPAGQAFNKIVSLMQSLSTTGQNLSIKFSQIPIEENTSAPAFMVSDTAKIAVYIQQKAAITVAQTSVDDTVSTGQTFQYTVSGNLSSNLTNARAFLKLPASFGGFVLNAPLNADNQAKWDITVPQTALYTGTATETLKVFLGGTDINTGQGVLPSPTVLDTLTIQLKPKLFMKGEIAAPGSAQTQGILSHGQTVTIKVWPAQATKNDGLNYAGLDGNGSIVLNDILFSRDKFEPVAGELYEKNFSAIQQELTFKVRAPDEDRTASINFRFRQLPRDKNSKLTVDVDQDSGTVSIPIRVRRKEITVTLLDSLIMNTTFTRGAGSNLIMAFRISNEGYKDPLTMTGLELTFKAHTDTISLSAATLMNMLDSVQVINYAMYKTILNKNSTEAEPLILADYKLNESNTDNPLQISFPESMVLEPNAYEDVLVMVRFKPGSITRSFRTMLSKVLAYAVDSNSPSTIVNVDGDDTPTYISDVFSVISNDPREAYGNYPNPFGQPPHETTKIVFLLNTTTNADVTIRIFTLTGELVKSRWNRNLNNLPRGLYDGYLEWDGRNDQGKRVLNGVYLCIIEIKADGTAQKYITKIAYIK